MAHDNKFPNERRSSYIQIPEIVQEFKDHVDNKVDKLEEAINKRLGSLEKTLMDPDEGTISRVKTLENDMYHAETGISPQLIKLNKIILGNGHVGLSEQIRTFKRRDAWLYGLGIILISIFAPYIAESVGTYFSHKTTIEYVQGVQGEQGIQGVQGYQGRQGTPGK